MAPLLRTGSHRRSFMRFISSAAWPLASTTTLAWISLRWPSCLIANCRLARSPVEQHLDDVHAVVGVDAVLARVVEHHLVELAAHDLPGLRALVRLVVPEVERRRQLAVAR